MVTVGDDVVVKYTLSKKNVERFSIGWDMQHFTAGVPLAGTLARSNMLELSY